MTAPETTVGHYPTVKDAYDAALWACDNDMMGLARVLLRGIKKAMGDKKFIPDETPFPPVTLGRKL